MKEVSVWYSARLEREVRMARWGHYGTPVLLFPTAGGDAEEVERFHLIGAVWPLIEAGRIKVYSCDSVAGKAWIQDGHAPVYRARLQNAYDSFIYREVVPAIHADCRQSDIEIVTAGASLGAFNAVASLCRHPDVFRTAIGMSGTYDLERWLGGQFFEDFYFSSPIHYLPGLDESPQLDQLRRRFVLLAYVGGRWEDPEESWRLARVLGSKSIPNRVDPWGPEWDHDWPAWRAMLPVYLDELS
ncbi:MAG: alpha/beta hydrolase-fold protein [Gammaproteobacteria bacterium]|jgi:esterase/lipase superfamily enzyme